MKRILLAPYISIILLGISMFSCHNDNKNCTAERIRIDNRWHETNGALATIEITNPEDRDFICSHINNFPEKGERVLTSYNYGYLELYHTTYRNPIQIIFTVEHGVLYRTGIGTFVYDDALTEKIMKLLKIKSKVWGS